MLLRRAFRRSVATSAFLSLRLVAARSSEEPRRELRVVGRDHNSPQRIERIWQQIRLTCKSTGPRFDRENMQRGGIKLERRR